MKRQAELLDVCRSDLSATEHLETGAGPSRVSQFAERNEHRPRERGAGDGDITHIPPAKGFVYLAAVVDWYSRRVLSWRVSVALPVDFCVEAVEEALMRHGKPKIFNTDQGCRFTSEEFMMLMLINRVEISMDGRGSWRDNVFIERLWRSTKYEEVYLRAYDTVGEARNSIDRYLDFYNRRRPHSSLDGRTPDQVYFDARSMAKAA